MASVSDQDLVDKARQGDTEAFGLLVRRHQRRIYRVAVHLTKSASEADDITQDTFVRAFKALDRFDGRSEPFTWLYRIAVNLSLNHLRSRRLKGVADPADDIRSEGLLAGVNVTIDPLNETHQRRLTEALLIGIDSLSETLRSTLVLVCIDGVSHEHAAQILGCPEGTVAWRVHEARRKLKAFLGERGFGGDVE